MFNGKTAYKSGTDNFVYTTMEKGKGKWYYEVKYNGCSGNHQLSIFNNSSKGHYRIYYSQGGVAWRYESHTGSSSTTLKSQNLSLTSGTVMGVAIEGINNKLTCYKNGVEVYSSKFSNFDLETNSFRASVSTGNSPSGSFNVTFGLEEGDFKYAIPEGYEPFGKPEPVPEPVKVKKLSVHLKEDERSTLRVTNDLADNVNFTWSSSDTAVAVGLEAQGLDLYSSTLDTQKILFSKTGLANGNHTIRIVVLGRENENAAGCHVTVDAFEYASNGSFSSLK